MNLQSFIDAIASKTGQVPRRTGSGYSACCPAHDDTNPSLSITSGSDGTILVNCFAGCDANAICSSLGLSVADLFSTTLTKEEKQTTIYSYRDASGKELYRKIRTEPGKDGKLKDFRLERTDPYGNILYDLKGCPRVLYRLPEIIQAISEGKTIYLVEGEKDADRLVSYGLKATTSLDSKRWDESFTEVLKEADVVLLYDFDKAGIDRKQKLCKLLYHKTKRLRVVDLPGIEYQESQGRDISDWLSAGHTVDQFLHLVKTTPDYLPNQSKSKIRAVTLHEFLSIELPEREYILSPIIQSQGLVLLYAKRGVGKTHVALGIAYAVASGGKFLKWKAFKPRKVLYIDGEMPASSMQERLHRIDASEDKELPDASYLRIITPDLQEGPMPDLATEKGREDLEEFFEDAELIIVDNISTLFRSGVENEAESWRPVQEWALNLRRKGKTILFVHHAGKTGQQRGTSKKEDTLDTVILLKHPPGYTPNQGAIFEVVFEKTRHFAGNDAETFLVQLQEEEDGLWTWEIEAPGIDADMQKVIEAKKEGLSIREIRNRTGLSKSQVETKLKKAKEQGLID